jgi:hypothetical protein
MILEDRFTPRARIMLAIGMGVDPDEKEIWAALQEAKPEEIKSLASEYKGKKEIYDKVNGGLVTGLSKENILRFEAMLGVGPEGEDPTLTKLKAQGGVNGSEIVRVIKTSLKSDWGGYKDAYGKATGPLRKFADELLNNEEKGLLSAYFQDSALSRIKFGIDKIDPEYVTFQVASFATEEEKKTILADAGLMGKIDTYFGARGANKIRDLLLPTNLSTEERAKLLAEKIKRESSFVSGFSNSAAALEDEQRELTIALEKAKADGKLTPEEQKKLDELSNKTESALAAYIGVRDELNGYLETALNLAASLVVSAATGGAAAGMLAAAVARAALAQAVVSVAVKKIAQGDNFNVIGPEGLGAFVSGFVDGAANAVGGPAAKSAISAGLRDSARAAALETGNVVFHSSGRTILTRAAEGAISSSPGAMVSTAVDDSTWKNGFVKGFGEVIQSGVEAGIVGAAVNVGVGALGDVQIGSEGGQPTITGIPDALGEEAHKMRMTAMGPVRCSDRCLNLVDSFIERAKRLLQHPDYDALEDEIKPRLAALNKQAADVNAKALILAGTPNHTQEKLLLREAHALEMQMCSVEYKVYGVSGHGHARFPAAHKGKWGLDGKGTPGEGPWYPDKTHRAYFFTKGQPIMFENGFPNLTPWAKHDLSIQMKGDPSDFVEADRLGAIEGFKRDPKKFGTDGQPDIDKFIKFRREFSLTWHHKENGTTMQLVPTDLHSSLPHIGGSSLSRGK